MMERAEDKSQTASNQASRGRKTRSAVGVTGDGNGGRLIFGGEVF